MPAQAGDTIGRDDELASIAAFVDRLPPCVLVLEGTAGIGKTTLWHEGVSAARERGSEILQTRPARADGRLAFAGIADLLGNIAPTTFAQIPTPQRRALRAALLLEDPEGSPPEPRTISVAFLSLLRSLATNAPVLVAIDDVQWLDEASVGVIAFVLRRLNQERVRALLTYRVEESAMHPELARTLRERAATTLVVGPLSLGALHALLGQRLGMTLPRPLLQRVHSMSAGNPFFGLEIAQAIQRRGGKVDAREALPFPSSVEALIGERLSQLPHATLEALAVVAAIRQPSLAACAAALATADVAETLSPAIRAGVLEVDGDRLRFSHPLVAAAAYARVDPLGRRELHRRLAEASPTDEERARHLAIATDAPDEDVARALETASSSAAARGATDAAADLLEMAVALTPEDRTVDAQRRKILAARQHFLAGAVARTREILTSLMRELPSGKLRAMAALSLSWATEYWPEVQRLGQQAIEESGGDQEVDPLAHYLLAFAGLLTGRVDDAFDHARTALALVEATRNEPAIGMHLATVILFSALSGRGSSEPEVARALDIEERFPTMPTHYSPSMACALRAMYADRLDEARRLMSNAERRVVERGDEYMLGAVRLHQTELEVRAGNWPLAARYAAEGLQITERATYEARKLTLLYSSALVDAHRGHVDQARNTALQARDLAARFGDVVFEMQALAVLGFLELSLGNAAAADQYLRPLPERLASAGLGEPSLCPALPNAVEALVLLGELELARSFTARLEDDARRTNSVWARALAARCHGLIAAAERDFGSALSYFARSLSEPLAEPFECARTQLALGSAQRRAGRRREARETLEQALAKFERLGAPLWAGKARDELARIGGRVAQHDLTATERRVAELVALGHTNKEVAAALVVSERAVEANLTRVYQKLGARSRVELGRRLAEARTTD